MPPPKSATADVEEFINNIEDERKRDDCRTLAKLMAKVTGEKPKMSGSIVGFGSYHYKYASGHEGDSCLVGFSPRKANLTMYLMCGFDGNEALLEKLGKYKTGVGCLYVKSLQDVDMKVLEELIKRTADRLKKMYPKT